MRTIEEGVEVAAATVVANNDKRYAAMIGEIVDHALQQIDGIAAAIGHVPDGDRDIQFVGQFEYTAILHPALQRAGALRRQIDQYHLIGVHRGQQNAISTGVVAQVQRLGVVGIETQQVAMRLITIQCHEWLVAIDEFLRKQTRHGGLADTALLTADEMNLAHDPMLLDGALHQYSSLI